VNGEYETSRLLLIQTHYKTLGDVLEWNAERFRRLAEALKLTVPELGALFRLTPAQTLKYMEADAFPPTVELHLAILSRAVMPTSRPPVFPALDLDP
jgi:hypothetical protein